MPFSLRAGRMEAKVATSTLSPGKEGPPAVAPQAVPFGWLGQHRVPGPEPRSCRGTRSSLQRSAVTTELSLLSCHHSAGTAELSPCPDTHSQGLKPFLLSELSTPPFFSLSR